jgi:long-chain acyl-CoA synthetase
MMTVPPRSVAALWRGRVRATPGRTAFRYREGGEWRSMTWAEADARVRRIGAGLLALGVPRGARVAILSRTRVEWILADFGILCAGAATSTVYPTSTARDTAYILEDAGCWGVFVEDEAQLEKVLDGGVIPEHVFVLEGGARGTGQRTPRSLLALEECGAAWLDAHPDGLDERIDAVGADDLATLIYTSGTTGPPKGVILDHDCWLFQAESVRTSIGVDVRPDDLQYLFLPLAHSFGKICELVAVELGVTTAVDGDLDGIVAGLRHERPTMMPAVPRVFEKIHHRITTEAERAGPRRNAVFRWAAAAGDERVRREQAGERLGLRLRVRAAVAERLVFRRLREALGGRIRAFVSGGAPLSPEIARFFQAAGMTVLEGYGLTETSAGAVANRPDDFRFGTVGRPFPGVEVRIGEGSEVLIRGRNVMRGYWNRPDATAEAIDADGWLHTGDIGRVDADGRLTITGRIKDLIVTSGGKNVAPQDPEHQIKARCPLVAEVVTVGDRRPYCVALVWLEPDAAASWAGARDLGDLAYAELARHPAVRDEVWAAVEAVNATLPPYATLKRIALVDDGPISEASGLLTPSQKVKRAEVAARYAERIDALYAPST